jgi:hypothetical protein
MLSALQMAAHRTFASIQTIIEPLNKLVVGDFAPVTRQFHKLGFCFWLDSHAASRSASAARSKQRRMWSVNATGIAMLPG